MKTQDYRITITAKADVTDKAVSEWLPAALNEGEFHYKLVKIYSTEIEPIDKSDPNNKYLNDMDVSG
jgi:hypothetical protein